MDDNIVKRLEDLSRGDVVEVRHVSWRDFVPYVCTEVNEIRFRFVMLCSPETSDSVVDRKTLNISTEEDKFGSNFGRYTLIRPEREAYSGWKFRKDKYVYAMK